MTGIVWEENDSRESLTQVSEVENEIILHRVRNFRVSLSVGRERKIERTEIAKGDLRESVWWKSERGREERRSDRWLLVCCPPSGNLPYLLIFNIVEGRLTNNQAKRRDSSSFSSLRDRRAVCTGEEYLSLCEIRKSATITSEDGEKLTLTTSISAMCWVRVGEGVNESNRLSTSARITSEMKVLVESVNHLLDEVSLSVLVESFRRTVMNSLTSRKCFFWKDFEIRLQPENRSLSSPD